MDVLDACYDQISGGREGHGDLGGEPRDSIADTSCSGVPNPDVVVHYANCTFCKSDVLEKRVSLV